MATRPMYNRRAIRPDGAFHRNKRRSNVNTLATLDRSAKPRGWGRFLSVVVRIILRRR
jgi:hypothetical protein